MSDILLTGKMPVLAMRGIVIFPDQTVHFDVGRVKSALALEAAMKGDQTIYLVPQKNLTDEDPKLSGLYPVGCVAKVKQILRGQGETIRVLVSGLYRARIQELNQFEPYLSGIVASVPATEVTENLSARALRREAKLPSLRLA